MQTTQSLSLTTSDNFPLRSPDFPQHGGMHSCLWEWSGELRSAYLMAPHQVMMMSDLPTIDPRVTRHQASKLLEEGNMSEAPSEKEQQPEVGDGHQPEGFGQGEDKKNKTGKDKVTEIVQN